MATFLDLGTFANISLIFVFIFVVLIVYALLTYTKVLGQNQFINVIVGALAAFFVILSEAATSVVAEIVPVFAVILVLVAIISIASRTFGTGVSNDAIPALKWVVLIVLIIAVIIGSLSVIRDNIDVPEPGDDFSDVNTVIFHPNFLGFILIALIAVFTVGLLASKQM